MPSLITARVSRVQTFSVGSLSVSKLLAFLDTVHCVMIGQRSQRSPGARRSLGGRHPRAPPPGDSDGEDDLMEYSDSEEVEQEDEEAVGSAIGSRAAPESSGDEVDEEDEEDEEEDGVEDGEDETEEDEDEEDSLDMESHECERRRLDMVAETAELEKQFTVLKEQ